VVDPGEDCDDGNQFSFDCCSSTCRFEPAGQFCYEGFLGPCVETACDGAGSCLHENRSGPCDDFNPCTVGDACVDGLCVGRTLPDGASCDDFNACTANDACHFGYCYGDTPVTCDACSYCDYYEGCVPYVRYDCQAPAEPKARLELRDSAADGRDGLDWRWAPGSATSLLQFGDPRTRTDYALCVFDDYGDHLLLKAEAPAGGLCAGRACWKANRSGYRYTDRAATPDGLRSITLKSGPAGEAAITVRGKGPQLDLPALPVSTPLIVQLRNSEGACWGTTHWTAEVSTPFQFRSRNGSPSGAFTHPTE
jgi:cysteine-rich repeat protein